MMRAMKKVSATLSRRIRLVAARGIISVIDDGAKMQGVQVKLLDGETREGERLQNYGFTSVPFGKAECIYLSLNGSRDQGVVIVSDDRRYRLIGLKSGEVALYTDEGDSIVLKRGKLIEVETDTLLVKAGTKVRFETPLFETTGNAVADGTITDLASSGGRSMDSMRAVYDSHTHPENDNGGPTGAPIGKMG